MESAIQWGQIIGKGKNLLQLAIVTTSTNKQKYSFRNYTSLEIQSQSDQDHLLGNSLKWNIYLHNENDFPDALTIHPRIEFLYQMNYEVNMRIRSFMKPSTSSRPCSQYQPKACKEIKVQQKIAKDYQCQAPIFYSGQHLDNKQISILPICNDSVILKMIALFEEGGLACSENLPCEHTDYIIDSQLSEYDDDSTDSSIRLTCR